MHADMQRSKGASSRIAKSAPAASHMMHQPIMINFGDDIKSEASFLDRDDEEPPKP
jgi:hypothetical protein